MIIIIIIINVIVVTSIILKDIGVTAVAAASSTVGTFFARFVIFVGQCIGPFFVCFPMFLRLAEIGSTLISSIMPSIHPNLIPKNMLPFSA